MLSKPDIQLVRFCRQIRQLDPFPDYPDRTLLPYSAVQELLYQNLFSEDAPSHPPLRYQLRVLKELVARIESSIDNWDEYVSRGPAYALSPFTYDISFTSYATFRRFQSIS